MEQKSSIIAIGLSVHHTPVDIREKLSIPEVATPFGCAAEAFVTLGRSLVLDQTQKAVPAKPCSVGLLDLAHRAPGHQPLPLA